MPLAFEGHPARKFVAEKIVECANKHTQTLGGLTEAGRRAVAELAAEILGNELSYCKTFGNTSTISISCLRMRPAMSAMSREKSSSIVAAVASSLA